MKGILIATDGSELAAKALDVAIDLAKAENAKLTIVNVVSRAPLAPQLADFGETEFAEALARRTQTLAPDFISTYTGLGWREAVRQAEAHTSFLRDVVSDGVLESARNTARRSGVSSIDTVSLYGDPAEQIITAARKAEADLIVVGRRGFGSLTEAVLGSVSQKVLHRAHVNVLTVV